MNWSQLWQRLPMARVELAKKLRVSKQTLWKLERRLHSECPRDLLFKMNTAIAARGGLIDGTRLNYTDLCRCWLEAQPAH